MNYKTLNEVRDLLRSNSPAFLCIGRPDRNPCDEWLENKCKELALEMLTECNANLTRNRQWETLTLLLCPHCKVTYTQKDKIWKQWEAETPGIDPGGRKGRSPNSKYFKPSESDHRRSSGIRLAAPGDSPAPRGRSCESNTPSSPTETVLARRAARYDSANPSRPMMQTGNNDMIMADADIDEVDGTGANQLSDAASTQPFRTPPRIRVSGDDSFTSGETSTWAPWALRDEVLRLLWEPLPKPESKGTIYAVEVVDTPYVKIGITTRKVSTRLKEVENLHGKRLQIIGAKCKRNVPLIQLYRLEKLVHADLAFFQRDLTVQRAAYRQTQTHREYFEVDLTTAERTIQKWWNIMQNLGLESGIEIDQSIMDSVEASISDIDHAPAGTGPADYEWWKSVNANHEQRLKIWSSAFRLDDGGHKRSRVDKTVSYLTVTAVTLCILYSSRLPDWVKHIIALLLMTAESLYLMDTGSSDGCITWIINTPKRHHTLLRLGKGLQG